MANLEEQDTTARIVSQAVNISLYIEASHIHTSNQVTVVKRA